MGAGGAVVRLAPGCGDAFAGALADGLGEPPPGFASSVEESPPRGAEGAAEAPDAGCSLQPAVTAASATTAAAAAAPRSA
ncbi:hypothetical protein GCM10010527_12540 [Streptomyces drozdowiczii]